MIRAVNTGPVGFRRRLGVTGAIASAASLETAGIGAAVSLASTAVTDWLNSIQLSHDADTATTLIVNGLAQQLQNLDNAYAAEPNPTCADQRAALDAYDQAWAWLQSPLACGNPNFGAAGNRCISDRVPGGRYPWQTYYRDPIANDPRVAALGCDSGQEVILPSVTTGTYATTGITSNAGSATTGQTAAQLAAAALAAAANNSSAPINPATGSSMTMAASSSTWLLAAAALGALLLLR